MGRTFISYRDTDQEVSRNLRKVGPRTERIKITSGAVTERTMNDLLQKIDFSTVRSLRLQHLNLPVEFYFNLVQRMSVGGCNNLVELSIMDTSITIELIRFIMSLKLPVLRYLSFYNDQEKKSEYHYLFQDNCLTKYNVYNFPMLEFFDTPKELKQLRKSGTITKFAGY